MKQLLISLMFFLAATSSSYSSECSELGVSKLELSEALAYCEDNYDAVKKLVGFFGYKRCKFGVKIALANESLSDDELLAHCRSSTDDKRMKEDYFTSCENGVIHGLFVKRLGANQY